MSKTLLNHFLHPEPMFPRELLITRKPRQRKSRNKVDARLLSTRQAADYLGISAWTVRRLAHDGELPFIRRKYFYFDLRDLDRYIIEHREREAL
jgi:excisionase family DNA binding protein